MIKLLSRNEIDDNQWNELINTCSYGYCYALTWYLDIVSPNWKALIFLQNGDYQVVMPLPIATTFGIDYVKQPLFCQQLGIFSKNSDNISEIPDKVFLEFFATLFQHYNYVAEYSFNIGNGIIDFSQKHLSGDLKPPDRCFLLHTHLLNLQQDYTTIYKNYNKDRKLNLKRAKLSQTNIIESQDINPLIEIFITETEHKIKGGVHVQAYDLLRKVYQALLDRNIAKIYYIINQQQEIESGILLVFSQRKIIYLFNAAKTKYRKNNGRTLLIDHVLQLYANKEYDYFDFESPEIKDISDFYQSFGAKPFPFLQIHYNHLPFWVQIPKKIRQLFYRFAE
jgi:hypothetical protein